MENVIYSIIGICLMLLLISTTLFNNFVKIIKNIKIAFINPFKQNNYEYIYYSYFDYHEIRITIHFIYPTIYINNPFSLEGTYSMEAAINWEIFGILMLACFTSTASFMMSLFNNFLGKSKGHFITTLSFSLLGIFLYWIYLNFVYKKIQKFGPYKFIISISKFLTNISIIFGAFFTFLKYPFKSNVPTFIASSLTIKNWSYVFIAFMCATVLTVCDSSLNKDS